MKTKLILFLAFISFGWLQSQEINCFATQQEFAQLVEAQNFKDASVKMKVLLSKCPTKDENLYVLGAKVIQNEIDLATNDDKEKAVKELIALYDKHDEFFPNNTSNNLINKATIYYEYGLGTEEETFKLFDKAFTKDKFQFVNALSLFTYFKLYNENYKSNDNRNFDQLLDRYSQVLAVIEKNKSLSANNAIEFENVKIGVNSMVKNYLTVENLTDYAERNIKQNQGNADWLNATVDLMLDKCSDKAVFGQVAYYLHSIQPSSKSAFALGSFNLKNNNREKAVDYLKQAAELASDKQEKAKIYATNASILFGFDKKLAKESILSAIQNDATNGENYIFLANLYSSAAKECGTTSIEQKAVYYLANKYAQKAAEVQPSLKLTSNALSDQYKKFAFTDKEKEQIKKADGTITIDCWINETVEF
jgi:hypothetical protein